MTHRNGVAIDRRTATVHQRMDTETVFARTPDDGFNQLKAFNQRTGGVRRLLFFGQGGLRSHQEATANITLFGRKLAPGLGEPGSCQTAAALE